MLDHDAIFEIYEIMKSEKSDFDKFLELQSKYGIDNIELLCKNFADEAIFSYCSTRLESIENNVYAFQEYASYVRQYRASLRGQIFKEQREKEKEGKKTL